uniref:Uncharacterized protein n=1 Tax=Anguilla anguilla TaxID=7936 RepID=A0A0E9X9K9_ANGAN
MDSRYAFFYFAFRHCVREEPKGTGTLLRNEEIMFQCHMLSSYDQRLHTDISSLELSALFPGVILSISWYHGLGKENMLLHNVHESRNKQMLFFVTFSEV